MSFTLLCHQILFNFILVSSCTRLRPHTLVLVLATSIQNMFYLEPVLPILYNPCEILFSFICDGYVLTRVNLRLRPHYFLVAFYWASGAATLLCAMLDPAYIVVLFYLVRFYTS
jgi:hypothetical protein